MPQDINVNAEDLINIFKSQRDAAMDEIAKQGAIIRALQRQVEELSKEKPDGQAE